MAKSRVRKKRSQGNVDAFAANRSELLQAITQEIGSLKIAAHNARLNGSHNSIEAIVDSIQKKVNELNLLFVGDEER